MKTQKHSPLVFPVIFVPLVIALAHSTLAAVHHVPAEYATIQAAVDATVSGDTIRIAAGDYYQQAVVANKTILTLIGEPGTVLHATSGMTETWSQYAILTIYKSDVVVSGISFVGDFLDEVYNDLLNGLYFYGAGGVVTNCTISGFRGVTFTGISRARGLHCHNPVSTGASVVNLEIVNSTFVDNEVAISLRGDPAANPAVRRVTATVKGNTIAGLGPAPIWNVGVWIVCGVTGDVIGNTTSDHAGSGALPNSGIAAYDAAAYTVHGRFVPLQPLNFEGNTFTNNGQHVLVFGGNNSRVVNNKFLGNVPGALAWGALGLSGTNIVVVNNNFSDQPTGILLVGNERWPSPWPTTPPAANPKLTDNWFCNVPEPIRIDTNLVSGLLEQGTETNCPFTPRFQSISRPGPVCALLRGWHGESVIIEASSNLVDWAPVHTNLMALPIFEYRDPNGDAAPQRFYRAVQ